MPAHALADRISPISPAGEMPDKLVLCSTGSSSKFTG
jgi:hypothetical protein